MPSGNQLYPHEIGAAVAAYQAEIGIYIENNRPYLSRWLDLHGGTTNLVGTPSYVWRGATGGTGCLELQSITLDILCRFLKQGFEIKRWMIGSGPFTHYAVLVYRNGGDPKLGLMFDPWIHQRPETFFYTSWEAILSFYRNLGAAREVSN